MRASSLPLRHRVGQLIIMGLEGPEVSAATGRLLTSMHPGGVILFARNIQSPHHCAQLLRICQTAVQTPLFRCVVNGRLVPAELRGRWTLHPIGSFAPDSMTGFVLADIDGDGDLDLFAGGYSRLDRARDDPAATPVRTSRERPNSRPRRPPIERIMPDRRRASERRTAVMASSGSGFRGSLEVLEPL